jgi:hypothetical protein
MNVGKTLRPDSGSRPAPARLRFGGGATRRSITGFALDRKPAQFNFQH